MFNLLLVDDEPIFIRGIRKLIDWESYGCQSIREAMDAEEALELIDTFVPDVIMTDLVMPGMGGLAFIHELSQNHPEIPVIILSGHGEFEFAREAMKNGVCEYLLKPVARDQLNGVVERVLERLQQQRQQAEKERVSQEQLSVSLPLLREHAVANLLHGHVEDEDVMRRMRSVLSLEPGTESYVVLMMELDTVEGDADPKIQAPVQNPQIYQQVTSLCDDYLLEAHLGHAAMDGEAIGLLLTLRNPGREEERMREMAVELGHLIRGKTGMTATFGAGGRYPELLGIHRSRNQACNALRYAFFAGRNRLVDIREVARGMLDVAQYPDKREKEVLDAVRFQPDADSTKLAAVLVQAFVQASGWQREAVFSFAYEFCTQLRRVLPATLSEREDRTRTMDIIRDQIWSCRSEQQLKWLLSSVMETTLASMRDQRENRKPDVIAQAKSYMEGHFHEELTLGEVAGQVFMSPTYFSSLFKAKTGVNFHAYLKRVRMETAARMLVDDSLMLQEIGAMVGFRNPRCFSEAFKRYHGMLPSEYRIAVTEKTRYNIGKEDI